MTQPDRRPVSLVYDNRQLIWHCLRWHEVTTRPFTCPVCQAVLIPARTAPEP